MTPKVVVFKDEVQRKKTLARAAATKLEKYLIAVGAPPVNTDRIHFWNGSAWMEVPPQKFIGNNLIMIRTLCYRNGSWTTEPTWSTEPIP